LRKSNVSHINGPERYHDLMAVGKEKEKEDQIEKLHCNECGGDRNQFIRREFERTGSDDETSWSDTAQILECCGCGAISFRNRHWFSEWDEFFEDDGTGESRRDPGIVDDYYPPPLARKLPRWIGDLSDETLRQVLKEVYSNLQADNLISAAMGARLLIDRILNLTVKDVGGFEKKLDRMHTSGHISDNERLHLLSPVVDAGNAASHRAFKPRADHINTMMDTIENLLHRIFVLPKNVRTLRKATPRRRKK
jgi:hypothetical protein